MHKDWLDVLKCDGGNGKHTPGSWIEPEGRSMGFKDTHSSMFRHLALSFSGQRIDKEANLDHLLLVAFRSLALYTRLKRGIKHSKDYHE
jgi:hypothetical protein